MSAPCGLKICPSTRNDPAVALFAVRLTVTTDPATNETGDVVALSAKLGVVGALAVGVGVATTVTTSNGAVTVVAVVDVGSPVLAEME